MILPSIKKKYIPQQEAFQNWESFWLVHFLDDCRPWVVEVVEVLLLSVVHEVTADMHNPFVDTLDLYYCKDKGDLFD